MSLIRFRLVGARLDSGVECSSHRFAVSRETPLHSVHLVFIGVVGLAVNDQPSYLGQSKPLRG